MSNCRLLGVFNRKVTCFCFVFVFFPACNVLLLNSVETESLTGPQAISKATAATYSRNPRPAPTVVHFKVSMQGITLTDSQRRQGHTDRLCRTQTQTPDTYTHADAVKKNNRGSLCESMNRHTPSLKPVRLQNPAGFSRMLYQTRRADFCKPGLVLVK